MLAVVRDISERKERERELERKERQFEATFNNPVSFVGLLGPDGAVRRINENALEFAGIDESEVRGKKFWETPWFTHSAEVQEELQTGITRAADGEYVRAEIPHRSPDGETVIMDSMLKPVRDDDDEVVAIVPSGHDILEEIKSEPRMTRLPVIILTSSQSEEELIGVYEKYANARLLKPVDPEEFADLVQTFTEFRVNAAALPPVADDSNESV